MPKSQAERRLAVKEKEIAAKEKELDIEKGWQTVVVWGFFYLTVILIAVTYHVDVTRIIEIALLGA